MPPRSRAVAISLAGILAVAASVIGLTAPAQAATPGAPSPCAAALITGSGDDYRVTWTRPVNAGGFPIWAYAIRIKGTTAPVVRLEAANKTTEYAGRSYDWTTPTNVGTAPLTFQVRAINSSGGGPFCNAVATGSSDPNPPTNTAPVVSAGADKSVVQPNQADLDGTVTDDGRPAGSTVATTWSKVSGPGTVTFGNASAVDTTAAFSTTGAYVLRLTASDGELTSSDDVAVSVTATAPPSGRPFIAYGESSFLQSEVTGAPVNAELTSSFKSFMASHPEQASTNYPRVNGVGSSKWGVTHVMSQCSDPVWKFSPSGTKGSAAFPAQWERLTTAGTGFHAPSNFGSMFTGTNDSPFSIIDMCNGLSVWASNAAAQANNVVSAKSFGAFSHASNGIDRRNPLSDSSVNERSRGVIPDSIPIRKDLMTWAKANNSPDGLGHTLEMFFVETNGADGFVHPMVGYEKSETGWGAEGTRIAVAPGVNLDTRNCSPEALVIARTLQHYGTYLGDNSGGSSTLKAQQEQGGTVWGSTMAQNELQGCISWSDFVVIEPGWQ